MKSIRLLLISVLTLCAVGKAHACEDATFSPGGYYMYRVYQDKSTASRLSNRDLYPGADENCKEWQKLTSETIPLDHIYKVVYEMSLEDIEKIYYNKKSQYVNRFLDWVVKNDDEILEFLYLAKYNENVRLKKASPWYYPAANDEIGQSLQWVADFSLANETTYLRDRYLLQAMRALFTLQKYQECIKLWDEEASKLPEDNLMRQLMEQYAVGANVHVKRSENDIVYFANIGDIESVLYCANRAGEKLSRIDALTLICQFAPNSPSIPKFLQECVRAWEPDGRMYNVGNDYVLSEFTPNDDFYKLFYLCYEMTNNSLVENPAIWHYTYAFLNDILGNLELATMALARAEEAQSDEYLAESIKVMRIYLDAKTSTYDDAYEQKLYAQLQWLDQKISNNITPAVEYFTADGYRLISFESYYYWNDMLRRILLSEVCPRMIESGKTTRALQLANMADNWLLKLVDKQSCWNYNNELGKWEVNYIALQSYRYSRSMWNAYDYRNHFFELIDAVDLHAALDYNNNLKSPQTEFDLFLNSRSYTDENYLNDIIGTKYLRCQEYELAMEYLGKVSYSYAQHLNVYLDVNPFYNSMSYTYPSGWRSFYGTSFKYDFAADMCRLESKIVKETDKDRQAKLLLDYASAIKESFGASWPITQYYKGTSFYGQVCKKRDWRYDEYTKSAMAYVQDLVSAACDLFTDVDKAAQVQYNYGNFWTVATKYPSTRYAKTVKGYCDVWIDHHGETLIK